jgi:hypothetical protein
LHPKRRSTPNDAVIADFIAEIAKAFATSHPDRIFNIDETSWKLLNAGIVTLTERGAEGVQCHFSVDAKDCLTAIATVSAPGKKQPCGYWQRPKQKCRSNVLQGSQTRRIYRSTILRMAGRIVKLRRATFGGCAKGMARCLSS